MEVPRKRPLKPCKENQERNVATNRCRKKCNDDQERNDKTGRCKKKAGMPRKPRKLKPIDQLKPCPPGSERNLETRRCRKIKAEKARKKVEDIPKASPKKKPLISLEEEAEEDEEIEQMLMERKKKLVRKKKQKAPRKIEPIIEEPKIEQEVLYGRKKGTPSQVSTKKLQKHQIEFAENIINNDNINGALAIHGVGSGKTLTAVVSAELYLARFPKSKVVVITPASLLIGFKQELFTYDPAIEKDPRYSYYTFDGFSNMIDKGDGKDICDDAMLIIDEAQNLRTTIQKTETMTTQKDGTLKITTDVKSGKKVYNILKHCSAKARKILLLSATPMVNYPSDIGNLMAMINKHEPFNKTINLDNIWGDPVKLAKYFGCRISFFENSPEVQDKFFPRLREVQVPIVMSEETYETYTGIENNVASSVTRGNLNISGDSENINAFYTAMRKASNAIDGDRSQKVNFIMAWITSCLKNTPNDQIGLTQEMLDTHNNKFIIFTHFLGTGSKLIKNRLDEEGIKHGDINGSIPKKKRAGIVADYVNGKTPVILISKAGGEGLNLLETGYIFIVESGWNVAERTQVIGRGVRFMSHINLPKKKRNVLVLNIFLIKPPEKPIFQKLINNIELTQDEYIQKLKDEAGKLSTDVYLYARANAKEQQINMALDELRKLDQLERCNMSAEDLNVSNLFRVNRVGDLTTKDDDMLKETIDAWPADERFEGLSGINEDKLDGMETKMKLFTKKVFRGDKDLIKLNNSFYTPPDIARDLCLFAGVDKIKKPTVFLEPTAGAGFIIYEALKMNKLVACDAVEKMDEFADLLDEFPRTNLEQVENFFALSDDLKYNLILMNPPFSLKAGHSLKNPAYDTDFIYKAVYHHLNDGGICTALMSNSYWNYDGDFSTVRGYKRKSYERLYELLERHCHYNIIRYDSGFKSEIMGEMRTGVGMVLVRIFRLEGTRIMSWKTIEDIFGDLPKVLVDE
jgi:superfamily II DNA or RNA helicase